MNKNKNIIIDFLNQYYITQKQILLNNINIPIDTKKYNMLLLFKLVINLKTNDTKIIYLNEFDENDKFYKDFYDNSIEKVSEYIYYIKNYLNFNIQDILLNNFKYNIININILIGAGLYLIHSNYYKTYEIGDNNNKEIYFFYSLDKD